MNSARMKDFAIIGGGFSGTMTAVNLARFSEVPLQLSEVTTLEDPSGWITNFRACKDRTGLDHLISQTKLSKRPDRICPNSQPGADALKCLGSFIHVDIDPNLAEGYRGAQSPYATTNNDYLVH